MPGPRLGDGSPFPTLWWLTCPWLAEAVSRAESAGGVAGWARRLAAEPALARRMLAADAVYRGARLAEDGSRVSYSIFISDDHRGLVTENTRFWNTSGIR